MSQGPVVGVGVDPVSHVSPENPLGQLQLKVPPPRSLQVPPLRHGLMSQGPVVGVGVTDVSQDEPENPVGQLQVATPSTARQLPPF
jgi:hypothetical protein